MSTRNGDRARVDRSRHRRQLVRDRMRILRRLIEAKRQALVEPLTDPRPPL